MGFHRNLRFSLVLAAAALAAPRAAAVTQYRSNKLPFLFDLNGFMTTLALPVTDLVEMVRIPDDIVRERLEKAKDQESIEPLDVLIADDEAQVVALAERIALPGKLEDVAGYLRSELKRASEHGAPGAMKTIEIRGDIFNSIDKAQFVELFAKPHHNLTLSTIEMRDDGKLRRDFMDQLTPYFDKAARKQILAKIGRGEPIRVDTELLPEFARKMVRHFVPYRGPNCFHAALAFQSPQLTASSLINVKEEHGYHRAMINYDELWRVLSRSFYEVNPERQALKYGDVLVFFDVPKSVAAASAKAIDFRWIRHTATYLFGGYTFSKGSKSANTPYLVRTLGEEWKTWKRFTNNLGVKIFRRSAKEMAPKPPRDLADWIY
jgi:hypothetical protein